jgi:protein-disulfide isomerase
MITAKNSVVYAFIISLGLSPALIAADTSKVIAKVGNTTLTEDQLRSEMGQQLYQAENMIYMTHKNWVDEKAQDILFNQAAKEAGLSRKDWEKREIDDKVAEPDPQQVQQMAGQFVRPGTDGADSLKQAKEYVANQNKMARRNQVYQDLLKKTPVELMVEKPVAPVVNVTYAKDDPMRGNPNAPITIVEFTDFQCPFCKRSQDTIQQIEKNYPKDVKLVTRAYPLPFHDRAKPASEAAFCAKEQGKYWEYRDKIFAEQKLSDADLSSYAKQIGLNTKKFEQCRADHKYASRIESDIADGRKYGVNGTPHFFINGESLVGAQPYQQFDEVIKNALSKKKS